MILFHKAIPDNPLLTLSAKPITEWSSSIEEPYSFYYSNGDMPNGIHFSQDQLDHLKKNKDIKVVYDHCGEPFLSAYMLFNIIESATRWQLNDQQIVIIVLDIFQKEFLEKILEKTKMYSKIRVTIYNRYFEVLKPDSIDDIVKLEKQKFSILCRRHRPWRSYFFSELFDNKLLEHFYFSYHGIYDIDTSPYDPIPNDIFTVCKKTVSYDFKMFIKDRPYSLDLNFGFLAGYETYLYNSDIHIVIEHSQFDEHLMFDETKLTSELSTTYLASINPDTKKIYGMGLKQCFANDLSLVRVEDHIFEKVCSGELTLDTCSEYIDLDNHYIDKSIGQSYFVSEKTYKPIATRKPFIVFSNHGYLEALKKLGFKTFSPYIDESYDLEPDVKLRIKLIIKEISRINSLNLEEYNELIYQCNQIAIQNKLKFEELQKANQLVL
jgi:hypothetical protein